MLVMMKKIIKTAVFLIYFPIAINLYIEKKELVQQLETKIVNLLYNRVKIILN